MRMIFSISSLRRLAECTTGTSPNASAPTTSDSRLPPASGVFLSIAQIGTGPANRNSQNRSANIARTNEISSEVGHSGTGGTENDRVR